MTSGTRQSRFFEWLSKSVSPAQLSEFYQAFMDLEDIISSRKYTKERYPALEETSDPAQVEKLKRELNANYMFGRTYKSGVKLALLNYYTRYLRENKLEVSVTPARMKPMGQDVSMSKEMSADESLIDRLEREKIPYVDKRAKNGALWIDVTPKTQSLIADFEMKGYRFLYSGMKKSGGQEAVLQRTRFD